jgi:hypothetical protein
MVPGWLNGANSLVWYVFCLLKQSIWMNHRMILVSLIWRLKLGNPAATLAKCHILVLNLAVNFCQWRNPRLILQRNHIDHLRSHSMLLDWDFQLFDVSEHLNSSCFQLRINFFVNRPLSANAIQRNKAEVALDLWYIYVCKSRYKTTLDSAITVIRKVLDIWNELPTFIGIFVELSLRIFHEFFATQVKMLHIQVK